MEENKISSLNKLECLKDTDINSINLQGNPFVSSNENYKIDLFNILPGIEFIDYSDKNGNEVNSQMQDEKDEDFNEDEEGEELEDDLEGEEEDDGEDDGDEDGEEEEGEDRKKQKK